MVIETLRTYFTRDLGRLRSEVARYEKEENIWKTAGAVSNSAGNLCLHIVGNLNTYIGKELGGTGYIRNRDLEFSLKDVPRSELIEKIDSTITVVDDTLRGLNDYVLAKEYPALVFEEPTTTSFLLMHLTTHLAYHLGQVNYHRRLLDN